MNQNPYEASNYGYQAVTAEMATADARRTFIKKTYLHLLGAILACAAIDAFILTVFHDQLQGMVQWLSSGWHWLVFLGAFMVVSYVADRWAHSNVSRQMQYMGLSLYVLAEAIILVPLLYVASAFMGPDVIWSAVLVTAVVAGGLTLTVMVTKVDFSFLRWALVAGGFIAFALIGVSIFMGGVTLGIWFSVGMVVLASGMILYTTSNILHHYNTEQYVAASLALFASVALLFWYVLQLFMAMDD